ncbi:hypothetical protein [Thermococcus peptonophilus]|uniref:hypothetical protein n=1 Tax=Thermococcus peptonophilus TaxID=53952 RepID=UPI00346565ED
MNRTLKYSILLLLAFFLFTMPITVPYFKSSSEYSAFNTGWNGVSKFALLLHSEGGKTVLPLINPPLDTYDLSGGDPFDNRPKRHIHDRRGQEDKGVRRRR